MIKAKNNILIKLDNDKNEYALMNPLSGNFDIMSFEEYISYEGNKFENTPLEEYLLERGYIYNSEDDENKTVERAYSEFKEVIDESYVQLMLIPTYGCNLACSYCYEKGVDTDSGIITKEIVDAFFEYAYKTFSSKGKKVFITLFGGEPLKNSPRQRKIIEYIIKKVSENNYELAAVTNGFDLVEYIELLDTVKIKEIQVTLDGSREAHDKRRHLANGGGTFDKIMEGIRLSVDKGFPINLRSVVDRENMADLISLAEILDGMGWLDLGKEKFKTQIGRNYELFECYAKPQHLMSQIELWAEFAEIAKENPILKKFHTPDFKGIRYLVETGEMYIPSFDTCPAGKTEWVFDLNGDIYGCTASCGREELKLGSYYPVISENSNEISKWQSRNVLNIDKCTDCRYNVICGGGCGVVAYNKNKEINSPDCRPIQEILELGIDYYSDEINNMADDEEFYTSGCLLCSGQLEYSDEISVMTCSLCGEDFENSVQCINGHFICDKCHMKDIEEVISGICKSTEHKNPISIAKEVFSVPSLNLHGPEHHSLVPAAIVAAANNIKGEKDNRMIDTALKRGEIIPGGACGLMGNCGACVGAGIACAVLEKSNPVIGDKRGNASRMTAKALSNSADLDAPRCCKREVIMSMETAMDEMDIFESVEKDEYVCGQFRENTECIGIRCPYFPTNNKREKTIEKKGCCSCTI